MKITAGLGSVDEYIRFVEAGADEFFSGFVPYSWTEKYGTVMPLNRREVLCGNFVRNDSEIQKAGTSDIQFPVLYSTAVSGDRGDHRELYETWIYELYYCRPGVDRLSEREGNPVRNPYEW